MIWIWDDHMTIRLKYENDNGQRKCQNKHLKKSPMFATTRDEAGEFSMSQVLLGCTPIQVQMPRKKLPPFW